MAGSGFFFGTQSPANTRITAATSGPSSTRTIADTARSLDVLQTATGTPPALASSAPGQQCYYKTRVRNKLALLHELKAVKCFRFWCACLSGGREDDHTDI